jgi:D-3-phosphoglycerate dehydrogenase / 2-oxoglutarate reductase
MINKLIFFDDVHPMMIRLLTDNGFDCVQHFSSSYQVIQSEMSNAIGLIGRSRFRLDAQFLAGGPNLKFIARYGVGTDHIDMDYVKQRGITVFTSPEGSADTVGEHTIGMMLCLLNHIHRADRQIRGGQWLRESNRGTEIKNKTIGILGYGNMGMAVARKLSGFQSHVIAYDKYKSGYSDAFVKEVDLQVFFEETDILTIHIPYTIENHYFINKDFLSSFSKNIFLLNLARGLVVHTDELVASMLSGKVIGAALDVLEYEAVSFSNLKEGASTPSMEYLLNSDHVLLTPHIGGWSFESLEGHARVLADKIQKFCSTK